MHEFCSRGYLLKHSFTRIDINFRCEPAGVGVVERLAHLIATKLCIPYIVLQFLVLSLIPFFMLAVTALFKLSQRTTHLLIWLSSTMLLGQVLLMRWNVVVGGQLLSKSMRGFTSYFPGVWEKEGILTAAVIFTMPFLILYVFHRLVPLFPDAEKIQK